MTEVLGATSRVPLAELSVEMICVPLRLSETGLDEGVLVCNGCVDDGDVCAEVDGATRSLDCQLI